jgi:hypothetical protein
VLFTVNVGVALNPDNQGQGALWGMILVLTLYIQLVRQHRLHADVVMTGWGSALGRSNILQHLLADRRWFQMQASARQ